MCNIFLYEKNENHWDINYLHNTLEKSNKMLLLHSEEDQIAFVATTQSHVNSELSSQMSKTSETISDSAECYAGL